MSGPAPDRPGAAEVVVDARGLRCPMPVIRLAAAARDLGASPAGSGLVRVLATDPAARADVPAWCRMRGERLVEVVDAADHTAYLVAIGAERSERGVEGQRGR